MPTLLKVPYIDLSLQHKAIKHEIMQAIERVIDDGYFILGNEVEQFEKKFAELCETKHAIGVNSGTDALILSMRALGIGEGDEVITAPNSFVASASSIALVGATPVFVDVTDEMNLDPSKLEKVITAKTKAIMAVHLTGRPADMDPILDCAKRHQLYLIEDAAQAVCARYKDQSVGSFGETGCFSLHPLKTLNACGDAGIITTNDDALNEQLRLLRNIGLKSRENAVVWAGNSRLDTMQAAILSVKLQYLHSWTEKRRSNAALYIERLREIPQIVLPIEKSNEKMVYHTFVIQAERRDELQTYLQDYGIGTAIHYPKPIHHQSVIHSQQSFPVCEVQAKKILSLPIHQDLEEDQIEYVASKIKTFYQG